MRRERLSVLAGLAVMAAGAFVFVSAVRTPASIAEPSVESPPATTPGTAAVALSERALPEVAPEVEAALFRSGEAALARPRDLEGLSPSVRRTLIAHDATLRVALPERDRR